MNRKNNITPYKKIKGSITAGWGKYINLKLLNAEFFDEKGEKIKCSDALCGACICGQNGAIWSSTDNLELSKDEINEINLIFKNNSKINKITIRGLTFIIDKIEKIDKIGYLILSRFDGGSTIGKNNNAYIIGIYNKDIFCKCNEKEIKQNQNLCNKIVQELTKELKGQSY